jgi:hypothetical protein
MVPPILKVAGPEAFKSRTVLGVANVALTYCKGEDLDKLAFPRLQEKIKAVEPSRFKDVQTFVAANIYDAIFVLKAGAEGAQSLDGALIAKWIEQSAQKITGRAVGKLSASPTNHFLIGADDLVIVPRPDVVNDRGMYERAGC